MGLRRTESNNGSWENGEGVIFKDPSLVDKGPSYALIRSQQLDEWLDKKGLTILWLIGGEKQMFSHNSSKFYGRLTFNAMYRLVDGVPQGGHIQVFQDRTAGGLRAALSLNPKNCMASYGIELSNTLNT